jgi:hypothetical protein
MRSATLIAGSSVETPGLLATGERRRSRRVPLRLTLYLGCNGAGHPLRTQTRNISSDGFYCLVDRPVKPGDSFSCDILIPTHASQDPDDVVYLRCNAHAARVESLGDGAGFGLACRIEDYRLIPGAGSSLFGEGVI